MRVRALPATLDRVQAQTNAGTFTWGVGGSFGGQSHPHTPSAPLQMEMSVTAITMFRRLHTHTPRRAKRTRRSKQVSASQSRTATREEAETTKQERHQEATRNAKTTKQGVRQHHGRTVNDMSV